MSVQAVPTKRRRRQLHKEYEDMFSLHGRKAVVTGGAGGLGLPMVQALLENGADVAIADLDPARADGIQAHARDCGRQCIGVPTDILDPQNVAQMVETVLSRFGHIDILINAAGMNVLKKVEDYDEETWSRVMDVNVKGLHSVTRMVGRHMIQRRYGRIVNISSVRSFLGMPQDYSVYCASKGAVNMYTRQVACEWAKYGVTANAIAPTFTRTPINSFQLDDPVFYGNLIRRIPLGRICTVRDICGAMLYLVSDAACFVTGQVLCVDGGLTSTQ